MKTTFSVTPMNIPAWWFGLAVFIALLALPHIGVTASTDSYRYVKTEKRQLLVDFDRDGTYEPYYIKGVGYMPFPVGRHSDDWGYVQGHPRVDNIYADEEILRRDFSRLKDMNMNTIRIWSGANVEDEYGHLPVRLTNTMLTLAEMYGIKVIAGFWVNHGQDYTNSSVRASIKKSFTDYVTSFKNHKNILFWSVGNENEAFTNETDPLRHRVQIRAWFSLVNELAGIAHAIEGAGYHPVATVTAGIYLDQDLNQQTPGVVVMGDANFGSRDIDLPNLDIWGSNVYVGRTFLNVFRDYAARSAKPFWIGEFGNDAWHYVDSSVVKEPAGRTFCPRQSWPTILKNNGCEDEKEQADYAKDLLNDLVAKRNLNIGGTYFEYSDYWANWSEWACEEKNTAECLRTINAPTVTFYWNPRKSASNYRLIVGTVFGASNIAAVSLGANTSIKVSGIPSTAQKIYVQLSYVVLGKTLTEFAEYPVVQTPRVQENRIKIVQYGSIHNFLPMFDLPNPDGKGNHEWYGIMAIEKNLSSPFGMDIIRPRQVYQIIKNKFAVVYQRPVLKPLPSYAMNKGNLLSIQLLATDPAGAETYKFSAELSDGKSLSSFGGSVFNYGSYGTLYLWPNVAGNYSIRVRVTDSEGLSDTKLFSLKVI